MHMETQAAIRFAGSAAALASLLNITPSAVSQWGDEVPKPRVWQLRVLRPEWFADERTAKKRRPTAEQGA
jgi:hypothetical protein